MTGAWMLPPWGVTVALAKGFVVNFFIKIVSLLELANMWWFLVATIVHQVTHCQVLSGANRIDQKCFKVIFDDDCFRFFVVWINFWLEQNKPKKSPALVLLFPCEKEERIFETWKQQCNNPSASNSDPRTCLWQWLFYLPLKREKDQLNIENLVPSWSMLGIGSKIFIYLWTNPKTNSKFSGGPNPASFWGVWWAYFFSPFCWVPFKSTTFSVFSRWNRATFCWWLQRSCISVIAAKDFSPQKDINVVDMWHI